MSSTGRVFAARLAGLTVFDPVGDQVGKVRDIVISLFADPRRLTAVGLVIEVPGRKRVFLPSQRVTSMDAGQVITTGVLNLRRFATRESELLVISDLLEREVTLPDGSPAVVEDLALERSSRGVWWISKVFVRKGRLVRGLGARLRRRGDTLLVDIGDITGLTGDDMAQGTRLMLASFAGLRAADIAEMLHDMSPRRRTELAAELEDERLADVLAELPEDDQVEIINSLDTARAANVLEEMQPDDAADLLGELSEELQETFLRAMDEEDAEDVRRLLAYDEDTAGGLMTSEPVILGPEASVAEALAHVRSADISPAVAAAVFVTRSPHETPTGRYLGLVHLQRMLREPPHVAVGTLLDSSIEAVNADAPIGVITRRLATYDLLSLPVTDERDQLLGAVTIDDVLDHILPEDWREQHGDEDEGFTHG